MSCAETIMVGEIVLTGSSPVEIHMCTNSFLTENLYISLHFHSLRFQKAREILTN